LRDARGIAQLGLDAGLFLVDVLGGRLPASLGFLGRPLAQRPLARLGDPLLEAVVDPVVAVAQVVVDPSDQLLVAGGAGELASISSLSQSTRP
jgi:hypothetical protein